MSTFNNLFTPSIQVEIVTDFDANPIAGAFHAIDDHYVYVVDTNGLPVAVSLKHMMACRAVAAAAQQPEDTPQSEPVVETPAPEPEPIPEATPQNPITVPSIDGNELRIVGRIDLDALQQRPRKRPRIDHAPAPQEPRPEKPHHSHHADVLDTLVPQAMGVIKRTGPKFGFITDNNGTDIRYQAYNAVGLLQEGQPVLFSTYLHPTGVQARAVHAVSSVGAILDNMTRMERYNDTRPLADMTAQLLAAFPDNQDVLNAIADCGFDRYQQYQRPQRPQRHDMDSKPQHHMTYTEKVKNMALQMLPDNYEAFRDQVLAMIDEIVNDENTYQRKYIYDLFNQLIKGAQQHPEERAEFLEQAINFYTDTDEPKKAEYFRNLSLKKLHLDADAALTQPE